MAPLFSALVLVPTLAVLWVVAFSCARFFQPTAVAVRLAVLFAVGAVAGATLSVVILALFISVGGTLASSGQVLAYLASLVAGGFVGGLLLLWLCIKYRVLTLRSSGTAQKRAAP